MQRRIIGFVLSGGVGSRLWPLSREDNPKQFHDLAGGGSMLARSGLHGTLAMVMYAIAGVVGLSLILSSIRRDRSPDDDA